VLDTLAFGGDEVGSVTARPCSGNPPPRLKRMIRSKSLVVYRGLKNDGVDQVIERLKRKPVAEGFVVGISIAKTNDELTESVEAGIDDYFYSLNRLVEEGVGDYYTINISCPTVGGGESFTDPDDLEKLLTKLATVKHRKPVYLKMPINQPWANFSKLLAIADRHGVHGVVIGNLNKQYQMADQREEAPEEYRGGLSGKPCRDLSNDLIRKTRDAYGDRFTIIGCGGILTPADALEKLAAGADLLQLITGMIFEGPHLMKEICAAIAAAGAASADKTGGTPEP
jgi:dihydroorotate dehydrogenase